LSLRTRKTRITGAFAVLAVSSLLALTACSNASGGGGSAGVSEGGPIKIGVVTNVGSALSNYPDIQVGVQAAVHAVNEDGGINGRELELVFCNTRGDVNQAATCGREMVDDGVVAIVGQASAFAATTQPVTFAAGIPEIGNLPLGEVETWTSEFSNPLSAGHPGNTAATMFAAKQMGLESVVIANVDIPGGNGGADIGEVAAKGVGLDVKERIRIPSTGVADYTPFVQRAVDSGADALYVLHGPVAFVAMVKAADAIGADIQVLGSGFTLGQSEAANLGALAERVILASPLPSVDDLDNEVVARYHEELDADGVPMTLELRRIAGLNGWLAAHAAAEVLRTIDGEVTRESVVEALKTTEPIELGGGIVFDPASLTTDVAADAYPRAPKAPVYFFTYKDGKMVDAGLEPITDAFEFNR
jgi:ABC-type branched-subunit amino acid transport system substrate-binding protein